MARSFLYKKLAAPLTAGKYFVTVKFMHGDADLYTTEDFEFNAKEELELFLDDMDVLIKLHYNGRLCDHIYSAEADAVVKMPEYDRHFGGDGWPVDKTSGHNHFAAYESMEIIYYNMVGEKFRVTIEDSANAEEGAA